MTDKALHETRSGHAGSESESEPAWIRDVEAATLIVGGPNPGRMPSEMVAEICAGETTCCEHCGEKFPMWPTKQWADHLLTAHGDALTIQARTGTAMMCSDAVNEAQGAFFSMMLGARVSLRRRGFLLGYLKAAGDETRIHLPS
jgi:hypothetical protein